MSSLPGTLQEKTGASFLYCRFLVSHPDEHLTPWVAPGLSKGQSFGGKAAETLHFITDELLPQLTGPMKLPVILGGYSLGGLFALWCAYQTGIFEAVAAVSPSLWYDGWTGYISQHTPLVHNIYLSLGLGEPKGRNPRLAAVGENISTQDALLSENPGVNHLLEWNPGNHFTDPSGRMMRGYEWAMKNLIRG